MAKTSHSYFVVMRDFGRRGLEATVQPEDTRRDIVDRIKSHEYQNIIFIHFVDSDYGMVDLTSELIDEAELELKEEYRASRSDLQAARFDHARALRNEVV